jgi:hypothetical protein
MKREVPFNLVGNISIPRAIVTLINQGQITTNDLSWYLIFAMEADFGHKYKTHGVVTAGDSIIAQELNCDPTTVCKKRNRLIKLGLLKTDDKKTKVTNYQLFLGTKNSLVVPIFSSYLKNGDQKSVSDFFLDEDIYMKISQDFTEKQRQRFIQKL